MILCGLSFTGAGSRGLSTRTLYEPPQSYYKTFRGLCQAPRCVPLRVLRGLWKTCGKLISSLGHCEVGAYEIVKVLGVTLCGSGYLFPGAVAIYARV